MRPIFVRLLALYLFFLFIATAVIISLPDDSFTSIYKSKNDDAPYFVGTLQKESTSVYVAVDVIYRYLHNSDTHEMYVSIQYFGSHFSPADIQPRIQDISVRIMDVILEPVDHDTSSPSAPHFGGFRIYSGVYEYYRYSLTSSKDYYIKSASISVDLTLGIEEILPDSENSIVNANYASFNLEKDFWIFNKTNVATLLVLFWLPLLYVIPYVFRHSSRIRSQKFGAGKEKHLAFMGIWFPNLTVMLGALLVAPIAYRTSKAITNRAQLVPQADLINNFIFIASINVFWYLVLPTLIELKYKWPRGNIFNQITVQSSFLEQLGVDYYASEIGFYRNIQRKMLMRIAIGGILLQVIQLFVADLLTRAETLTIFIIPIVYMIWVYQRPSILNDYWRVRTRVKPALDRSNDDEYGDKGEDGNGSDSGTSRAVNESEEVIVVTN